MRAIDARNSEAEISIAYAHLHTFKRASHANYHARDRLSTSGPNHTRADISLKL